MVLPNISTAKFSVSGGTSGRSLDERFSEYLTPYDFNPTGLDLAGGVSGPDASPAFQAMFDAAFGPAGSPHGLANCHLNRPCYIPPGFYNLENTLYLTDVVGGTIMGGGLYATKLVYSGAWTTETPVLSINGMAHSTVRQISFNNAAGQNSCGVFLGWDGTIGVGDGLHDNLFFMCGYAGKYGMIIAGQGFGGRGIQLVGAQGAGSHVAGTIGIDIRGDDVTLLVIHSVLTDYAIVYKVHQGTVTLVGGSSEADDSNFDIAGANTKVTTVGVRAESDQMYRIAGGTLHATGTNFSNATTSTTTFAEVTGGVAIFDACNFNVNLGQAGIGELIGNGGQVYLRACRVEAGYKANYTGTLVQDYVHIAT